MEEVNLLIENYVFEKTQSSKYLGTTITANNDWKIEISNYINKGERVYFALIKYFKSKFFLEAQIYVFTW